MRKNLSVCILAVSAIFASCSTSKEVVTTKAEPVASGYTMTYGPKGKIVYSQVETPDASYGEQSQIAVAEEKSIESTLYVSTENVLFSESKKLNFIDSKDFLKSQAQEKSIILKWHKKSKEAIAPRTDGDDSTNWAAIVGFVLSLPGLFIAGILFGLLAIIFSAIGMNSNRRGFAIAGLIIGIVDVIGAIIVLSMM